MRRGVEGLKERGGWGEDEDEERMGESWIATARKVKEGVNRSQLRVGNLTCGMTHIGHLGEAALRRGFSLSLVSSVRAQCRCSLRLAVRYMHLTRN